VFAEKEVELAVRAPLRHNANPLCNVEEASDVLDAAQKGGVSSLGGHGLGKDKRCGKRIAQRKGCWQKRWDRMMCWVEASRPHCDAAINTSRPECDAQVNTSRPDNSRPDCDAQINARGLQPKAGMGTNMLS
jgi:hypothetical protein